MIAVSILNAITCRRFGNQRFIYELLVYQVDN
jgi:hypothetical protein